MSTMWQIEELFATLNRYEQLLVIEALSRRMRQGEIYTEESARPMMELANEPGLNEPYPDPPEGMYTPEQLIPRGDR